MEISAHTPAYATQITRPERQGDAVVSGREGHDLQDEDKQDPLQDPSSAESREVETLKQRDREVRAHELAHLSAAGQYAQGGASFEYQRGPDGQRYAVGGEVSIDTASVAGDPEATIRKLQAVQRAALAPAEPSGQDRSVAAQAMNGLVQARVEARQQASSQRGGVTGHTADAAPVSGEPRAADTERQHGHNAMALQRYQQAASAAELPQAPGLELIA